MKRPLRLLRAAAEWAAVRRDVDELRGRVAKLEAEMSRRPAPDLCPVCHSPLKVTHWEAINSEDNTWQIGERRYLECTKCQYARDIRVMF